MKHKVGGTRPNTAEQRVTQTLRNTSKHIMQHDETNETRPDTIYLHFLLKQRLGYIGTRIGLNETWH